MRWLLTLAVALSLSTLRSCSRMRFSHPLPAMLLARPSSINPFRVSRAVLGLRMHSSSTSATTQRSDSTEAAPHISSSSAAPSPRKIGAFSDWPQAYTGPDHFKRAMKMSRLIKVDESISNAKNRGRKFSAQSIDALMKGLTVPITSMINLYRTAFRKLHPYEETVANLTLVARQKKGHPDLQTLLRRLKALRATTSRIAKEYASKASNASTSVEAKDTLQQAHTALEELYTSSSEAEVLREMAALHRALRSIPVLSLTLPTVVLVGMPNVGKSSLVRALSTALPEVNNYPFTTRGVTIGHIYESEEVPEATDDAEEHLLKMSVAPSSPSSVRPSEEESLPLAPEYAESLLQLHYKRPEKRSRSKLVRRFQVMDTPGLLDRPFEERNEMEQLTFASLLHLPTAVVYVMDITNSAGEQSTIDKQLRVRAALKERFPRRPWVDVISKSDTVRDHPHYTDAALQKQLPAALYVSVKSGENIVHLQTQVRDMLEYLERLLYGQ